MTTHDHSSRAREESDDALDRDRIARELAALGEMPPEDEELDWARDAEAVGSVDVATTHALFVVAGGEAIEPLGALDQRRVWKRLAGRLDPLQTKVAGGSDHAPRRAWVAILAMAAGVILVTRMAMVGQVSAPGEGDRAAIEALGSTARASLDTLGGTADGARARALADDYATRLRADREGT